MAVESYGLSRIGKLIGGIGEKCETTSMAVPAAIEELATVTQSLGSSAIQRVCILPGGS